MTAAEPPRIELTLDEAHGHPYLVVDCSCGEWLITGVAWTWTELRALVDAHLASHKSADSGSDDPAQDQRCPNYPEHDKVEIAFHDDEFRVTYYHCTTDFGNGVVCHAEWGVQDA